LVVQIPEPFVLELGATYTLEVLGEGDLERGRWQIMRGFGGEDCLMIWNFPSWGY